MKFSLLLLAVVVLFPFSLAAQSLEDVPPELQSIMHKVDAKSVAGKTNEADFADEFKALDALIAKHKGEKTEEAALIALAKAAVYSDILDEDEKFDLLAADIARDYPDTKIGVRLKHWDDGKKLAKTLTIGVAFPDFSEQDLAGKPLSLTALKGKIVLLDFWATTCPPCVAEMHNVREAWEKHHTNGFEIIGITTDADRAKLDEFIKQNQMAWPQFFDGQGNDNKLAVKYGVNAIPMTYLLDGNGKIIAKDLRGFELEKAVAEAMEKNRAHPSPAPAK